MKNSDAVEKILEERYYLKDANGKVIENWEALCRRVAGALCDNDPDLREKLFAVFLSKDAIMASPTLMNADARLGMLSSCFIFNIEDDVSNIFETMGKCGLTFKKGGGVGLDLSKIRPAGSIVSSTGGYANGPVGLVMPLLNATGEAIKGGGLRKAAILAVLRADHPDIHLFINSKIKEGLFENMNISVALPKEFWDESKPFKTMPFGSLEFEDEIDRNELLDMIAGANCANGEPGIIYLDTVNKYNFIPNEGEITHANPCVTGDTLVKTENGEIPIKDLVGKEVKVWSMNEKTGEFELKQATKIVRTKRAQSLIKVQLWNNKIIRCTADHKIFTNFKWQKAGMLTGASSAFKTDDVTVAYYTDHGVGYSALQEAETIDGEEVFDMEVADNHNFVANGIVVHNCGEFFNVPWNSCNLASINLNTCLIQQGKDNMGWKYAVNWDKLAYLSKLMTIALDNTIDVNKFPIPEVERVTKATRPLGLGVFGLANVLIKLRLKYSSPEGRKMAKDIVEFITYHSMQQSVELAVTKGKFPAFKGSLWDKFEENIWLKERLEDKESQLNWEKLAMEIAQNGLRNCHNTIMMPTGTTSFICDSSESSGIEPIFKFEFKRMIKTNEKGETGERWETIYAPVMNEWVDEHNGTTVLPDWFQTADQIGWVEHILMQAEIQRVVHGGCSKTINLPADATPQHIKDAIKLGHATGCKGMTFYRDGSKTKQVLESTKEKQKHSLPYEMAEINKLPLEKREAAVRYRIKDLEVDPDGDSKQYVYVTMKDGRPVEVVTKFDAETKEQWKNSMRDRSLICRLISVSLRYGIPLEEIVKHCEKTTSNMSDFPGQLASILKGHLSEMVEGKEVISHLAHKLLYPTCKNCGGEMIYKSGCVECPACGYSKCS